MHRHLAVAFSLATSLVSLRALAQQPEDDIEVPSTPASTSQDAGAAPPPGPSPPASAQAGPNAPVVVPVVVPVPVTVTVTVTDPSLPAPTPPTKPDTTLPLGLTLTGFVQTQYEHSALSEDQLQQGGL
ncbi:MAG: hypothetical protein JWM74_5151, partial [Myxococcaceae bacterium]|nr:hypothetical protein [Myxococcaceae bacterium]